MKKFITKATFLFFFVSVAFAQESPRFKVPTGFKVEHLYKIPKEQGSWVAMTVMPNGDFITSDQYGGLYRVNETQNGFSADKLDIPLFGAHGLLWHRGNLYVSINEDKKENRGIYKVSSNDNGKTFSPPEKLFPLRGGGEHGVHSLVPSPEGDWIYVIGGNYISTPKISKSYVPQNWGEDQLLPRNADGKGHAKVIRAPAGWIARFRAEGSGAELVASGFRNPYDMAFNADGELFAYDADMEWDIGSPWYRPTRVNHIIPGAEFGWRHGTGKWPAHYEDSLGSVVDIGPGCPTGVVSGKGAKFPAKYQKAIFCYDWTFATIYAVHLTPKDGTYIGEKEEFFSGKGMALTDGVIGKDGAMYFLTGGRRTSGNLWRIRYVGTEPTDNVWPKVISKKIEKPNINSDKRAIRYRARVAFELEGADAVRAIKPQSTWGKIAKVVALARAGEKTDKPVAMGILGKLDFMQLTKKQRLSFLRAQSLVFIRHGEPDKTERQQVLDQIDSHFPSKDKELNAELCRMLCYLQAPKIVERTLGEMAKPEKFEIPEWAKLIERNDRYGKGLKSTLESAPSGAKIHYAYCLRVIPGPWTEGQRKQLMQWYSKNEGKKAGDSFSLALRKMRLDTMEEATEAERVMIKNWGFEVQKNPLANLPKPKGPPRLWTVEQMITAAETKDSTNIKNGRKMFQAVHCMVCHRHGSDGGSVGPDLTQVSGRFDARALAEAILEPHKEVSDQYQFSTITKNDGSSLYGKVLDEKDEILIVANNPYDFTQTVEVDVRDVKKIEASPFSPMPVGLVNRLNEQEMKDLMAFLLNKS